jgi:AraC family transcriptional regulator of adaptative response / DNA-3-methyladenine glycosylase II
MPVTAPEYYQAFLGKDVRFDGRFVAGVKTTGIYCKPSCSAKKPAAENVVFFDTPAEAEAAGFRSCRKCKFERVVEIAHQGRGPYSTRERA